jgi:hypothetical protein
VPILLARGNAARHIYSTLILKGRPASFFNSLLINAQHHFLYNSHNSGYRFYR